MKFSSKILQIIILFLIFTIFLSGCGGVTTPTTNLSGNWTMTNTTTYTDTPLFDIDTVINSKYIIYDNSDSLTIYGFHIIGLEYINWDLGYGTFNNSIVTINIYGSYKKPCGTIIYTTFCFEGTINADGISGSGTWFQAFSWSCDFHFASGTTILIKG